MAPPTVGRRRVAYIRASQGDPWGSTPKYSPVVKARLVGINHVALEVGDVEEALDFYGRIFELTLRGRAGRMAFVDIGDQFIALAEGRRQAPDDHRHFGLVVDDKERALAAASEAGAEVRGNDFLDPWGNRVQVVDYRDVQFTKTPAILRAMELGELPKTEQAQREISQKLGPDALS
jgi:lactoylglutathione lyase